MAEYAISRITLRSRLQYGGLRPEEAFALAADAGRALARAHAAGRIHGNLSAENFLLHGSSVTIQSFGCQGATAEETDYLAPERLAGGPPTIAADIYSFGRILELIQSTVTLGGIRNRAWEITVQRCLDPDPERRFASVDGVLQALGLDQRTLSLASGPTEINARKERKEWGQFQLLQRLGAGGFGEVYRAWDPTLEREVALKLLRPRGLKPEEEFAAIVAEARAMARVRHPNTVSVHGVDRHDGRVGLWSDFIRGQTLACWVETEGLRTQKETAEIGIALCNALSAVHHAGLLHRDIKPGNAMQAEDGRILLMDFGLSHELHQEKGWGGTVEYMAPELLAGGQPSVQSDIYAMGILLNDLCTGNLLNKDGAQTETKHGQAISSALGKVIETATNADPQKRYASAANLHDALAATVASSSGTALKERRGLRTRFAWIAAAVVLLFALAFFIPQVRREAQARFAGTSRAAYQDYLEADDALVRYDKPGNTQKAMELYRDTLERSPHFALAEAGLARAEWRMYLDTSDKKWVDAASQDAASAAAMNQNLAPVQMTLGTIHVEEGKVPLGIQELEQARQLDPRSAEVHAAAGEAYRVQGRGGDAKTELQTAMDLAPDDWRWPYLLAALEIDAGDFKAAESNLKIALEKTPDNARVLYNMGLVYRKQGKLEEAGKAYQDALKFDSSYFPAAMALGTVRTLQQRYPEALEIYKRAVEMRPADWRTWGSLASAQEFSGADSDEVARNYRKAIELAAPQLKATPDSPFLVSRMGKFYASLHDSAQALPLLRKAFALAPNDAEVLERLAESYELLGKREEALKLINKALQSGFSVDYSKKTPVFKALRKDARAPHQLRDAAVQH